MESIIEILKQKYARLEDPTVDGTKLSNRLQDIKKLTIKFDSKVESDLQVLRNELERTEGTRPRAVIKGKITKYTNKMQKLRSELEPFGEVWTKKVQEGRQIRKSKQQERKAAGRNKPVTVFQLPVTVSQYKLIWLSRATIESSTKEEIRNSIMEEARNANRSTENPVSTFQLFRSLRDAQDFMRNVLSDSLYQRMFLDTLTTLDIYKGGYLVQPTFRFGEIERILKVNPEFLVVRGASSWLYSIDAEGQNRIKDQCLLQFLVDGLANDKSTKRSYKNVTRSQMIEIMKQYRTIDRDFIVQDAINFCEHFKICLTLVFPDYSKIYHKMHDDKHLHLYGMVNNGHISLITSTETKESILRNDLKPKFADTNKPFNYYIYSEYSDKSDEIVEDAYNLLVKFTVEAIEPKIQQLFILEGDSCNRLAEHIFNKERLQIENLRVNKRSYVGFSYKCVFVSCNKHAGDVLFMCDQIRYPFKNQLLQDLTHSIIDTIQPFPKTTLNRQTHKLFETIKPAKLVGIESTGQVAEIDTTRDYSNILFNTEIKRFFYDSSCSFQPIDFNPSKIKDGHYLVKNIKLGKCPELDDKLDLDFFNEFAIELNQEIRGVVVKTNILEPVAYRTHSQEQIVNSDLLQRFIRIGAIDPADVFAYIEPIGCLLPKFWKAYHEAFASLRDPSDHSVVKRMINFYIGTLGSLKANLSNAFLTTDVNVIISMMNKDKANSFSYSGELYTVYQESTRLIYENNKPLHQDIVLEGTYRMLCLEREIIRLNPSIKVVGYNTDAIYLNEMPKNKPKQLFPCLNSWGSYKYNVKSVERTFAHDPADYQAVLTIQNEINTNWRNIAIDEHSDNIVFPDSFLLTGAPGTGKSYTLKHKILPKLAFDSYFVMAATHKAVCNLNQIGVKSCTLDLVLYHIEQSETGFISSLVKKFSNKTVIIDEIALCSLSNIKTLYKIHLQAIAENVKIKWIFIGDFNQCANPSTNVMFKNSYLLRDLCDNNLIDLKVVHRYDAQLKDKLEQLLDSGKITLDQVAPNIEDFDTHICFTHNKRVQLNDLIMQARKPDNCLTLAASKKKLPQSQIMYLYTGLPIVCIDNTKEFKNRQEFTIEEILVNKVKIRESMTSKLEPDMEIGQVINGFTVLSLDDKAVLVKDSIVDNDFLAINFRPRYAINVHVAQSATIEGSIVIHELDSYDKSMAYTALSRATSLESIYVVSGKLGVEYEFQNREWENDRSTLECPNLQEQINGYIYHLIRNNTTFYVGQTTDLKRRKLEHESKFSGDFIIKAVRTVYKNENINQLETDEIEKQVRLGVELENKRQMPTKSKTAKSILTKGVVKPKSHLGGTFYNRVSQNRIYFEYYVNGKKTIKSFGYKKIGYEAGMVKAKAFQEELYK